MDKKYKLISELSEWASNPRNINGDDFLRLKNQLELLGQHSPLLVTADGIVLGGNMRLRAMRELGWEKAWIVEITFHKDEQDLYHVQLDGVEVPKTFTSVNSAMMEYSLSHNERSGYYDSDMLANIMPQYNVDWDAYSIDTAPALTVQEFVDLQAPPEGEQTPEAPEPKSRAVKCPSCGSEFDPKDYMKEAAYVEDPLDK